MFTSFQSESGNLRSRSFAPRNCAFWSFLRVVVGVYIVLPSRDMDYSTDRDEFFLGEVAAGVKKRQERWLESGLAHLGMIWSVIFIARNTFILTDGGEHFLLPIVV